MYFPSPYGPSPRSHLTFSGLSPDFHRTRTGLFMILLGFHAEFHVWRLKNLADALIIRFSPYSLRHFSTKRTSALDQFWIEFRRYKIDSNFEFLWVSFFPSTFINFTFERLELDRCSF